ncbi:unnamed protein product [Vicia faba]|uniref:Transmembrane protein n=1 Tax=Vicia faba TaxID=3906 RepID=A0AAV1AXP3_VICFA|nr:unnamed protein product [Vicia faba]
MEPRKTKKGRRWRNLPEEAAADKMNSQVPQLLFLASSFLIFFFASPTFPTSDSSTFSKFQRACGSEVVAFNCMRVLDMRLKRICFVDVERREMMMKMKTQWCLKNWLGESGDW